MDAKKMWLNLVICVLACVKSVNSELRVFYKCCPENQSLVKMIDLNGTSSFECRSRETVKKQLKISASPLIISENIKVAYGFPGECEEHELSDFKTEGKLELSFYNNVCYDRLVIEAQDDEWIDNNPKIVGLKCNFNETENTDTPSSILYIGRIKKCCPENEAYDVVKKICTQVKEEDLDEKFVVNQIKDVGPHVFEVDAGFLCKESQYTIDLKSEDFALNVYGSSLIVSASTMTKEQILREGEWCMDRQKEDGGSIARVCANRRDGTLFGAYPIRKCCPLGMHFKVRSCNTARCDCVPNTDHHFTFNMSTYLDPLKEKYEDFPDLLGIRTKIRCPSGKYVMNNHNPGDTHSLNRDGTLQQAYSTEYNYCVEEFDRRFCNDNNPVMVAAVLCYTIKSEPHGYYSFSVRFVMLSVSAVFLALTLVVYISLPELRNLHGRTLICHVGTMLLAFSVLARVQYGKVEPYLCVLSGYMIYFGLMAAFAWLNVMCVDIWWTFRSVRTVDPLRKAGAERRRFLWYSLYAWSIAIVLTMTVFLLDKFPVAEILDAEIGMGKCWFVKIEKFNDDWPRRIFFLFPIGLITSTNFVLWVMTARHCARVKSEVQRLQAGSLGDRAKRRIQNDTATYILNGKLWIVMGVGWVAEIPATLSWGPGWLWTIINCFNQLQGVFIFIILIMKPKLYYLIRKRLGLEKPDAKTNSSSCACTSPA